MLRFFLHTFLGAATNVTLPNTTLSFTVSADASKYFMGLGNEGHDRVASYPNGVSWSWAQNSGGENQLWTGVCVCLFTVLSYCHRISIP